MANKKNINQFKEALFSNTDFLKSTETKEDNKPKIEVIEKEILDADIREKFILLADYDGISEKELINKALNHYLRLKSIQLEQAIKMK